MLPAGFDLSKVSRILGWGRPLKTTVPAPYCAIIESESPTGSVLTACRGRWPSGDPWMFLLERDRTKDRDGHVFAKCGACDDIARAQRLADGLRELRSALVIETRPFPAFAISIEVVDNATPALVKLTERMERLARVGDRFDFSDVYDDLGGES